MQVIFLSLILINIFFLAHFFFPTYHCSFFFLIHSFRHFCSLFLSPFPDISFIFFLISQAQPLVSGWPLPMCDSMGDAVIPSLAPWPWPCPALVAVETAMPSRNRFQHIPDAGLCQNKNVHADGQELGREKPRKNWKYVLAWWNFRRHFVYFP